MASYDRLTPLSVGVVNESFFNDPFRAETVAAFWSRHYNLSCHAALKACVYRPLVVGLGLSKTMGTLGVFFVSGFWHLLPVPLFVHAPDRLWFCASCIAFFMAMGALVVLEHKFKFRGKAWVWLALLGPAPLFLESYASVV